MLDMIRKESTFETLDMHLVIILDFEALTNKMSKELLISNGFKTPLETIVKCKKNVLMEITKDCERGSKDGLTRTDIAYRAQNPYA